MNGNGKLADFLQRLSEDRELQEAYTRDPEGTLRQAGLSDETIQAVLSRDLEQVKGVLEKEAPGIVYMCFMTIIEPPA
jgi:Aromatic-ring-opening dioxygenase LigAB, LigA subunit